MLLSNYIRLKEHILNCIFDSIGSGGIVGVLYAPVRSINGNEYTRLSYSSTSVVADNYTLHQNLLPRLGTGNTEVNADNYCLANDVTSSFSNLTATYNEVVSTDTDGIPNAKIVFAIAGVNSSADSITIKEIGLYKKITFYVSGNSKQNILFMRHVLDTPITVAAGDSFTLSLQWIEY